MVIYNKVIFREDSLMKCNSKSICSKIAVNLKRKGIIIDKQIAENIYNVTAVNNKAVSDVCLKLFRGVPYSVMKSEYDIALKCYDSDPIHFMRIYGKPLAFEIDNDIFDDSEQCFCFLMEKGKSFEVTSKPKYISWYIKFMKDIAEAISVMHSNGIAHFDIKVGNTVIKNGRYAIIDFGIAKYIDKDDDINLYDISGTPYFLSPDVIQGTLSHKCDIYSFGMMVRYILLDGKETLCGKNKRQWLLEKKELEPLYADDKYVQSFLDIVNKMTVFDPMKRYQNISEVMEAIYSFPVIPDIRLFRTHDSDGDDI